MVLKIRNWLKRFGIYLLILVVTLEVSPFVLSPLLLNERFRRSAIQDELERMQEVSLPSSDTSLNEREGYLSEHILHPYLGFVHKDAPNYNDFGFPASQPILKHSDSAINICIMGGSVAKQLVQYSSETLKDILLDQPEFTGKQVHIVTMALGGFKQPQQLLALNYMLSLGAEYDIVINLDGFNEVVLPLTDNLPFRIYPSYPRHWNVYSRKSFQGDQLELIGKQAAARERQKELAERMEGSIVRFSNFGLLVWKIRDRTFASRILALENEMRNALMKTETDSQSHGPGYLFNDTTDFLLEQAAYWARCSRQIHALSKSFGYAYFHFLQPNQYVKGSKQLTPEELRIAYEEGDFAYKKAVERAYPMLIREGKSLAEDNIRFIDLTNLFLDVETSMYADKCCHFNKQGYDFIAKKIARSIIQ